MAKSIHLETRTSNFLELLGNGKRYRVPPYQRDYSWTEENWDDLWSDIQTVHPNASDRHYMGTLVIETQNDRDYVVIDGQQRLATLSILALVIIRRLMDLAAAGVESEDNRERAESLRLRFIGEKDPASLILTSKLTLNETDNGFYQDYLVAMRTPTNVRGLPRSNRRLWECFQWFDKSLSNLPGLVGDGRQLAELLNETIARRLLFILINVDDDMNAYTVFETLNARGLELSATDLLKNYLFSRVQSKSDLEALQRRWRNLVETVQQERFPEFLRYHLLCSEPQIRSARLFKIVRNRVTKPQEVLDLLDALDQRSELFSALSDESHGYWMDHSECRPLIRERILYRSQQSTPLLFAAWERFSKEDFARVLKLVNAITFRFTTVSGLNTNELEPVYHRAAKGVLDGSANSVPKVFEILRGIYVDDHRFRQNFEVFELPNRSSRLAKFVLCRLESDQSGRSVDAETDPGTIEHILPESPTQEWNAWFNERQMSQYVYRVGNLTLLESAANRNLGNASFVRKLEEYPKSQYQLTREVAASAGTEWTPGRIERRQKEMAARAAHLWRSDFA